MKRNVLWLLAIGMLAFAACKNKGKYELDQATADTAMIKAKAADSISGPKLVKTGGINFKVKNVLQSSEKIVALTAKYQGAVVHHLISAASGGSHDVKVSDDSVMRVSAFSTTGEMTVRIPSQHLEEYLDSVSHLATFLNNSQMDITDKSFDYQALQLKQGNRQDMVSREKKGKIVIKDPSAVLNLKDDLVDEQIENRRIDDAVKYSTVSLNFSQSNTIVKEVIVNDDPSAYTIPFFKRLGLAFENGWQLFNEFVLLLVNMWLFILAGVAIWWGIRLYKQGAMARQKSV